jgi:hypothetical protein
MLGPEDFDAVRARWIAFRDDPLESAAALVSFFEGEWAAAAERLESASLPVERAEAIGRQVRAALVLAHHEQVLRYREPPTKVSAADVGVVTGPYLVSLLRALTRRLEGGARAQVEAVLRRAVERAKPDYRGEATFELGLLLAPEDAALLAEQAISRWNFRGHDLSRMAALLPPERAAVVLAPHIAEALLIADLYERWSALFYLVVRLPHERAYPLLRELYERRRIAPNFDPDEIFAIYEGALDPGLFRELVARECASPFNAFTAWRLGDLAAKLPADERGPIVERAIDEFEKIALTPIDPGNDDGPFIEMAHLLDARQVRRALAIVDRMSTVEWLRDLDDARAALAIQLAALGELEEANAILAPLADAGTRGRAAGRILGNRLVAGEDLTWRECLADLERDPSRADPAFGHGFFSSLCRALDPSEDPPREDVIEGCLSLARSLGDDDNLMCLVESWHPVGPADRWIDTLSRLPPGAERIPLELDLAKLLVERDRAAARRLLDAALEELGALPDLDPDPWMRQLLALRPLLTDGEGITLFARWMRGSRGTSWPVSRWSGYRNAFAGFLQWLGGDDAVVATALAIDEAACSPDGQGGSSTSAGRRSAEEDPVPLYLGRYSTLKLVDQYTLAASTARPSTLSCPPTISIGAPPLTGAFITAHVPASPEPPHTPQ